MLDLKPCFLIRTYFRGHPIRLFSIAALAQVLPAFYGRLLKLLTQSSVTFVVFPPSRLYSWMTGSVAVEVKRRRTGSPSFGNDLSRGAQDLSCLQALSTSASLDG
jgi:hypothetical protein